MIRAPHSDHRGVGSIVGAQFGKDILDASLDDVLRDRELRGNLFIGIPGGDQPKHIDFTGRQGFIVSVLSGLVRELRGKCLFPGMNRANCPEELLVQQAFQEIRASPDFHGAQDLDIAAISGQHNDAGLEKFAANGNQRIQAIHFRHLQVHQSDVRAVRPELLNRFPAIGGLRNQAHVRLGGQKRGDAATEQGMIVDRQNPN